jgi:heme A synthase
LPKESGCARSSIRALAMLALLGAIADILLGAVVSAGFSPRASLARAHWLCAIVVLAFAAAVVLAGRRANTDIRRPSLVAAALVLVDVALGVLALLATSPLPVLLAHNVVAALLVAVLVSVNERLVPDRAQTSAR